MVQGRSTQGHSNARASMIEQEETARGRGAQTRGWGAPKIGEGAPWLRGPEGLMSRGAHSIWGMGAEAGRNLADFAALAACDHHSPCASLVVLL